LVGVSGRGGAGLGAAEGAAECVVGVVEIGCGCTGGFGGLGLSAPGVVGVVPDGGAAIDRGLGQFSGVVVGVGLKLCRTLFLLDRVVGAVVARRDRGVGVERRAGAVASAVVRVGGGVGGAGWVLAGEAAGFVVGVRPGAGSGVAAADGLVGAGDVGVVVVAVGEVDQGCSGGGDLDDFLVGWSSGLVE
jgi:hypothetical protein